MAVLIDCEASEISAGYRTGTRMFQSIMVLDNGALGARAPPHDHLDDLESFCYVLCYIMHSYAGPGKSKAPDIMALWDHPNVEVALSGKTHFLYRPLRMNGVALDFWGPTAANLLAKLHMYISGVAKEKDSIVSPGFVPVDERTSSTTTANRTLADLHADIQNPYEKVLELFDRAIKQLEAAEAG